jgi:hypothetical protein
MYIQPSTDNDLRLTTLQRACHHHDHLKSLVQEYQFMREQQTYARLVDPHFRTDPTLMAQSDSRTWLRTSLVIKLPDQPQSPFFQQVTAAYQAVQTLLQRFYPTTGVDVYLDTAHITVKTLAEDQSQNIDDLLRYRAIIQPIVAHWLDRLATATELYALGLFSSLTKDKGLSLGLRFYPTLPLLQIIRGEVGVALYNHAENLTLRPEQKFHTMLIHATGLRARLIDLPVTADFSPAFKAVLESYDQTIFGVITDLQAADFCIRHGYSDQLVPLFEVACA